ncbi:hypothetical protein BG005_001039, partial [Podila minutissima]
TYANGLRFSTLVVVAGHCHAQLQYHAQPPSRHQSVSVHAFAYALLQPRNTSQGRRQQQQQRHDLTHLGVLLKHRTTQAGSPSSTSRICSILHLSTPSALRILWIDGRR